MLAPALTLSFTSALLSPLVTFARANATATRVNASGIIETVAANTARFNYNPLTLACNGLLIEEARANLFLHSADLANNTVWTRSGTTSVANVSGSTPDGGSTVSRLTTTATAATFRVQQNITVTSGLPYATSIYFKKGSFKYGFLYGDGTRFTTEIVIADLDSGVLTVNSSNVGSIEDAGGGWFRVSVVQTAISSGTTAYRIGFTDQSTSTATTGVAGNGFFWGAQAEQGSFPTSYIPTTTTSLTRNADAATITGTNFSDWWQAGQGGVLVRARPGTVSGVAPWVQFDDGTANEIIALRGNTTNPELYIVDGGTPQAQIDAGTIAANTDYSLTGWWETNDCKARLDSGAVVTDTSATIPTVTQARLGSDGTNYLNGHLASIIYYDTFFGQIYTRRKNKAVFTLM